jgi:hypothetical protein
MPLGMLGILGGRLQFGGMTGTERMMLRALVRFCRAAAHRGEWRVVVPAPWVGSYEDAWKRAGIIPWAGRRGGLLCKGVEVQPDE